MKDKITIEAFAKHLKKRKYKVDADDLEVDRVSGYRRKDGTAVTRRVTYDSDGSLNININCAHRFDGFIETTEQFDLIDRLTK